MEIKYSGQVLLVLIVIFLFLAPSPSFTQSYKWPVVVDPNTDTSHQSTITSTMTEPRDNGTNRNHFHWGIDIDDNYLVDKTGQYPIYVRAIEDGELLAIGDDAECIKHSRYRYCHIEFIRDFKPGDEVESGDVFAKLEDEGHDNDPSGDHLHFEEAVESFSEEGQEFDINRIDPLRSFRDKPGGLDPALTDSVSPTINEVTFFENDPDPTNNPDGSPDPMDKLGDNTWVVWGPVDVGAKIRDPGISPTGSLSTIDLGIHGFSLSITENSPLLKGSQNLTSEFSHQFDTVPGVHNGLTREDITKSAFLPPGQDDEGHHYNLLAKPGRKLKDETDLTFEGVFRSSPESLFHLDRGIDRAWFAGIGGKITHSRIKNFFNAPIPVTDARIFEGSYRSQVSSTDVHANQTNTKTSSVVVDGMRPFSFAFIFNIGRAGNAGAGYILEGDDDGLEFLQDPQTGNPFISNVRRTDPDDPIEVLLGIPPFILPPIANSLTFAISNPNLRTNLTMDGTHLIENGEKKADVDDETVSDLELSETTLPWPPEEDFPNPDIFSRPDIFVKTLRDKDEDLLGIFVENGLQNEPRRFELSGKDRANTLTDGTPSRLGVRGENGSYPKNDSSDTFDSTLELIVHADITRPGAAADYYNYSNTDKSTVKLNLKDNGNKEFWGDTQPGTVMVVADGDTVVNKSITLSTDEDEYNSNISVQAKDHVFVALLDGANLINTYYWENVSGTWKRQTRKDESILDTETKDLPEGMKSLLEHTDNKTTSRSASDVLKTKPGIYIEKMEYGFTYETSKGDKMYCVLKGDGELKLSDVEWK